MAKRVIVFGTPTCHWCNVARKYFKEQGIKFKYIDITKDPEAARDAGRHCRGVPVILIGSRWICGFDKNKIESTLRS